MKLINKAVTLGLVLSGLLAGQAVAGETWNNDVETHRYNFDRHIGSTYVRQVTVRSGTVETDYSWEEPKTQVTALINTGGCDAYSNLYLTMQAELKDADTGEYISGSTSFYVPEKTSGYEMNVTIDDRLTWPEDGVLTLTFTDECI